MMRVNLTCPCDGYGYVLLSGWRSQSRVDRKRRKRKGEHHLRLKRVRDWFRCPCSCWRGRRWDPRAPKSSAPVEFELRR